MSRFVLCADRLPFPNEHQHQLEVLSCTVCVCVGGGGVDIEGVATQATRLFLTHLNILHYV